MPTLPIIALFALWFLVSVLFQIRPVAARIGRFDRLGLLPKWTFFAPNPGIHDHHIIYRECDASLDVAKARDAGPVAGLSPWRQLADLCSGHNILFVWNPQRRVTKTISDLVNSLAITRRAVAGSPHLIQFTVDYFLLLHLVQRGASECVKRQFAIVRSHGFASERSTELVFISNFHNVR